LNVTPISILIIFIVQSLSSDKAEKVSFSHQLEHLVNLNLLQSEHNRKISQNENLVTFSGKFKDHESEEGKNRFKYLELLSRYHLIEKDENPNKPGRPTYYKSQVENLSILLDFQFLTSTLQNTLKDDVPFNPVIREKPKLPPRVVYNINDLGNINSFTVSQKTKAKRLIKRNIHLTEPESQFMKCIPYPTMEPRPFLDICQEAGISDVITIKKLQFFVEKMKKYEILDIGKNRGKNDE